MTSLVDGGRAGRAGGGSVDGLVEPKTSSATKARRSTEIGNSSEHVTTVSKEISATELPSYLLDRFNNNALQY